MAICLRKLCSVTQNESFIDKPGVTKVMFGWFLHFQDAAESQLLQILVDEFPSSSRSKNRRLGGEEATSRVSSPFR